MAKLILVKNFTLSVHISYTKIDSSYHVNISLYNPLSKKILKYYYNYKEKELDKFYINVRKLL